MLTRKVARWSGNTRRMVEPIQLNEKTIEFTRRLNTCRLDGCHQPVSLQPALARALGLIRYNERSMKKFAALVPMRHHSQRVPGKNYRPLAGKPLYQHIVETLLSVPEISIVVVDTSMTYAG